MSVVAAEYVARLELKDDNYYSGMRRAGAEWDRFTSRMGPGSQQISSAFGSMGVGAVAAGNIIADVAQKAISSLAGMASHVLSSGFSFNSLREQSQIAFTQLLGSVGLAKEHIAELIDLSNRTPFESEGIIKASQRLQAMGFAAKDVIPTLTTVADAVAGVGGGQDVLQGVITALGQIQSKGKASAEEMMQLAERGIPAWQFLAKAIGKDVPTSMKLVEKGAISADVTIKAILAGMEEKFGGLAAAQSKTWQGLLSTISDVSKQVFGELTGPLFERAREALASVADFMPRLIVLAQEVGIEFNRWIDIFAPIGKELSNFFQQLEKSLNGSGQGFKNFRDGAEMVARFLSFSIPKGLQVMTEGLKIADQWMGKLGGSVHDLIGFLNPLLGLVNQLGKFGNVTGLAPDRTGEEAWRDFRKEMRETDKELRDMRKGLADNEKMWSDWERAFGKASTGVGDKAKKLKQTISEMSPFITERAIAGSPEAVKNVIERFVDNIVNTLNSNRDRVGEVGGSIASMFLNRFESSLGGDKKSAFFENVIDDLRERIPELDRLAQSAVELLKTRVAQYGVVTEGIGLRSEQSMRSIIDNLRKQVGISDAIWKGFSAGTRKALNEDFIRAANDYISILEDMSIQARTSALDQTVAIKVLFAEWRTGAINTEAFLSRLGGRTADFSIKAISDIDAVGKSVKGLSERVSEAMARIRGAMEETPAFQVQDLFSGIASQIETLSERSGMAVDKLQEQFRVKLVDAMKAGKTGAADALASLDSLILNSQLAKLESVWGVPMGRAIEAILVHFNKLKTGVAKQITAVGELFAALPDKLGGGTINKIINTVNEYVNLVSKALNVLDAFGLKLPEPLKKLQDILNGGAQSTAKIMADMAANVESVIKHMADEVIKTIRLMVEGIKKETSTLPAQGTSSASQFSSNFVGGIKGLPDIVGGILGGVTAQFGGMAGKVVAAIGLVIKSIESFNKIPPIMNATDFATTTFANNFVASMNQVGSSAEGAANRVTGAMNQISASTASAGKMVGQLGGILAGLGAIVAGRQQGGVGGAVMGGIGGLGAGSIAGGILGGIFGGPAGALLGSKIGALAGAALGALFGGLGSKSELEKAQEAAALQQARDAIKISQQAVLKAVEETKQSMLDTVAKARDIIESIRFHTSIGRAPLKAFFKDLHRFMEMLAEEAGTWKGFASDKTRKAIKDLSSGVELLALMPAVFEGIRSHLKVPDISFSEFFADADTLINKLGEFASSIKKKIQKQIGKLGERVGPGVELVPSLADALTSIFGMRDLPDEQLNVFERNLDRFLDRLGSIAEKANKGMLKAIGFLGEQGKAGVEFATSIAGLMKAIIDTPLATQAQVDAFLDNASLILNETISALGQIVTDGLAKARVVSEQAAPILSFLGGIGGAIKSALEAALSETPDFSRLKANMLGMIQAVVDVAAEMNTQGVDAAALFSEAGQKVMGFLGNVGSTMKSLDDIFRVQFDYAFVKEAARGMIDLVVQLAQEMGTEGVAAAASYAASATAIVNFVRGIGDAFKSVKEAGSVTVQMVIDFVNGQKFVVDRLGAIANELGPDAIALAVTTADQIASIVSNSLRAIDFYNAIANVKMVAAEAWDFWVSNIAAMVDAVTRGANLTDAGVSASIRLKDNTALIRDNARAAFDNLLSLVSSTVSGLSSSTLSGLNALSSLGGQASAFSTVGNQPFTSISTPQFVSSPVVSPGGFSSSFSARPQQTVVNINVTVPVQGNLIHTEQVTQTVMRAIVTLVRTGQLPIKSGGSVQLALG